MHTLLEAITQHRANISTC